MQLNIPISNLPKSIDLVSLDPPSQPYPVLQGRDKGQKDKKRQKQEEIGPSPTYPPALAVYIPPFSPCCGKVQYR
jgi:hypothetical protein